MSSILVIEDEERIASFLAKGLKAEGFTVTVVGDGITGLDYAVTGDFDLVILDIGLPGMNGFEVLERLGAMRPDAKVIVLSARDSAEDIVAGLEGGAIDYVAKPFSFAELLARVRLRLAQSSSNGSETLEYVAGGVRFDVRRRAVFVEGKEIDLSARELALAEVLMSNSGRVLSREQLLSKVWGYDFDPNSNIVDVYIRYLRKKIGADFITTVRGLGYRVDE